MEAVVDERRAKEGHGPLVVELGLVTTLNTDDPAVSDIDLSGEYASAVDVLGFSPADVKQFILNGADCALLPAPARAELVADFKQALTVGGALSPAAD